MRCWGNRVFLWDECNIYFFYKRICNIISLMSMVMKMKYLKKLKKKYLIGGLVVLFLLLGIGISFSKKEAVQEEKKEDTDSLLIVENEHFDTHNTSERTEEIQYIVIHYTGEAATAQNFVHLYNMYNQTTASADYFVDFDGIVYQYNMEVANRYSWSVGGEFIKGSSGGSMFGIVTNENSINVELCVDSKKRISANDPGWILHDETVASALELVKYLMNEYDISVANVVRHYDVNGKLCPGIIGWNVESGSEDAWNAFKAQLN